MLHWQAEILMPWCFDAMCRWRVVMVVNFLSQSTTGQKWLFDPTTCLSWCSRKPVLDRKVFEHKEHVSSFCWGVLFWEGPEFGFSSFFSAMSLQAQHARACQRHRLCLSPIFWRMNLRNESGVHLLVRWVERPCTRFFWSTAHDVLWQSDWQSLACHDFL